MAEGFSKGIRGLLRPGHGEFSPSQQCPNTALCLHRPLPIPWRGMMANTVPTSHPPERGQASLREAKGLVHDTARQKGGHTCVCVWWLCCHPSVHPLAQPCSDQTRQRLCHIRKSLSGRQQGKVGLIYLFSFKKPKGTLDIKKFRNKRSEKCSNMEAGSRSEPSSEAKTSLKPHTATTAGSLSQPRCHSLLRAFVQLLVGHRLHLPAPHKALPTFSAR